VARGKRTSEATREQIRALKETNPEMSNRDIAKIVNLPPSTVDTLMPQLLDDDTFLRLRAAKKQEHIIQAHNIASQYMQHLQEPDVIGKASARDSAIVAGTMIDKAQLLAGEPTQIQERQDSLPELLHQYARALAKYKSMVTG